MKKLLMAAMVMFGVGFMGTLYANEGWLTDYKQAKAEAAKSKKVIFMEFSGSDWCPACIALNKEILSKKVFKEYAKDRFVLLSIDMPRYKKLPRRLLEQNYALMQKYGVQAFPTVLLLDPKGNVLAEVYYEGETADAYLAKLNKIMKLIK